MDLLPTQAWLLIVVMFLPLGLAENTQSETDCARSIKESLHDPFNQLSSWRFNDIWNTSMSICSFNGVECYDNKILSIKSIKLSGMGLIGEFPRGIANCSSLETLDLSDNHLYGSIPSDIWNIGAKYVTILDLSSNKFSGEIPAGIANCFYLNSLKLNNNSLTGRIPQQLVTLAGLSYFTVANNRLSGPVPPFQNSVFPAEMYANNRGLCGYPLDIPCESGERDPFPFKDGFIIGWAVFFSLSLLAGWFIPLDKLSLGFVRRKVKTTPRLQSLPLNNRTHNTMISNLEKFASRMSFYELNEATNNFSENNIISVEETRTTYKATHSNGWSLAISRLSNSPHLEYKFQNEIRTLGRFRHTNLVPLIGFCNDFNGRFIIYKFMPNGSLHDCLFSANNNMEWPVRAWIAIGIAKGIAWIHQNKVVHHGINSKCVLLDENFDPKISYFGKPMSRNGDLNVEFSGPGSFEEDVYEFGMVLLELVTGKTHENLISSFGSVWIWDGGDMFELIRELQATGEYNDEMCHFLRIAGKCIGCDQGKWPSMAEVYQMLIGTTGREDRDTMNEIQFANDTSSK